MAEAVELKLRDIKLLQYRQVVLGEISMDEDEQKIFEKETWKLFIYMIGQKLVEKYKDKIQGECIINFYPAAREEFDEMMKRQNVNLLGKELVSPLFYIKFDKNLHVEFCDKGEEKIPKNIKFTILCR